MKILSALVAFLCIGCPSSFVSAGILDGPITNSANGHVYYLLDEDSWQNSEAQAIQLGGHLVTINDQSEQDWVFSTFGSRGGTHRSIWIGLHREENSDAFKWASYAPVAFTNWAAGEPNNGGGGPNGGRERWVHMERTENGFGLPPGFWNDLESPNYNYPQFDPICGVVEVDPEQLPTLHVRIVDGGLVEICWTSQIGRSYQVQYSSDLSAGGWANLGVVEVGNGTLNWISEAATEEYRFYRVIALP